MVADWVASRPVAEVMQAFMDADAAVAQIYDAGDVLADPQVHAMEMITTVQHPILGDLRMQNVLFRMSETPGSIRTTGRGLGEDTDAVLIDEFRIDPTRLDALRSTGAAR